jgi:hypothetical protein
MGKSQCNIAECVFFIGTAALGLMELDNFEEIWGKKYPAAIGKACLAN